MLALFRHYQGEAVFGSRNLVSGSSARAEGQVLSREGQTARNSQSELDFSSLWLGRVIQEIGGRRVHHHQRNRHHTRDGNDTIDARSFRSPPQCSPPRDLQCPRILCPRIPAVFVWVDAKIDK